MKFSLFILVLSMNSKNGENIRQRGPCPGLICGLIKRPRFPRLRKRSKIRGSSSSIGETWHIYRHMCLKPWFFCYGVNFIFKSIKKNDIFPIKNLFYFIINKLINTVYFFSVCKIKLIFLKKELKKIRIKLYSDANVSHLPACFTPCAP